MTACQCQEKATSSTPSQSATIAPDSPEQIQTKLFERGRLIYKTNCTACHHADPKKPGSIGPEIFGSSLELIQARVVDGSYPADYKPKRTTHAMVALPHLKNEIPALVAFLNEK